MGGSHSYLSAQDVAAYVQRTTFTDSQVNEWYRVFKENYPAGYISKESFIRDNEEAHGGPPELWERMWDRFEPKTHPDQLNFGDFLVNASNLLTHWPDGGEEAKLKWVFECFDKSKDGKVTEDDIEELFNWMFSMAEAHAKYNELTMMKETVPLRVDNLKHKFEVREDGMYFEDFVEGCRKDPTIMEVMTMHSAKNTKFSTAGSS